MDTKNIVSFAIVAFVVIAGGYLIFSGSGTENQQAAVGTAFDTVVTITYGDAGFDKESVTIRKGQTVIFENKSAGPLWVASGPHPTHDGYPEKTSHDCLGSLFDECASVPTNGSWSFTFNSVGSWTYHNHMNAPHIGTIIVTE